MRSGVRLAISPSSLSLSHQFDDRIRYNSALPSANMRTGLSCFLPLLALLSSGDALYSKSGPVQSLSRKSFQSVVIDSDLPAVVEFFAPWCGHCKALAPAYQKVATNLEGIVNVAAVDCDAASNRQLCGEYGVQGFPTIKLFPSRADTDPRTKKRNKAAQDYNGARTAKGIADAATAALSSDFITRVNELTGLDRFKSKSNLPKVLLVSAKARSTPLYKSLSARFNQVLTFGEARDSDEAVKSALGVSDSPQLLLLPLEGEPIRYTGPLKPKELIAFLQQHTGQPSKAQWQGPGAGGSKAEAEREAPQVVQPAQAAALAGLAEREDALLLAFLGDSECKAECKAFNALVSQLGGMVEAVAVNVSKAGDSYTAGWPIDVKQLAAKPCELQLVLIPFGDSSDADDWQRYTGSLTAKEVQRWVAGSFPSRSARLDAASIQPFLALQPQVPKVLLFTDKAETPPVYAALAAALRGRRLLFGEVHSGQADLMQQFGVIQVPALRLAFTPPAGATSADDEASADDRGSRLAIQPYTGPFTYAAMAGFLNSIADMLGQEQVGGSDAAGRAAPAAEVLQVNDQAALEQACPPSSGICVLAVLDASSGSLAEQLSTLQAAVGKHVNRPLHFAWVHAGDQAEFLSEFGLSAGDAPTVIAFSASKQRQGRLRGSYTAEGIADMLAALLAGRHATQPLQVVPRLVDGGEAATSGYDSGQSQQEQEVAQEEFDLSDILGEEVAGGLSKADRLVQIEAQLEEEAKRAQEQEASQKAEPKKKSKRRKKSKSAGAGKDEL